MSSLVATLTCALLSACGGGGGDESAATATASATATAPALSLTAAPAASATALAPVPAPEPAPTSAPAPAVADTSSAPGGPTTQSLAETIGTARALSKDATLEVRGVRETPATASALPTASKRGSNFYVDSRNGDDTFDGRAATAGSIGTGPWKSLARVMQSGMGPGDTLVLACGSSWRETLRLPANGSTTSPVVVMAPAGGCGSLSRPTIDGSVVLPASAWSLKAGSIYKTTLDLPALQLVGAAAGPLIEARHPNPDTPTQAGSPYLSLAADSSTVQVGGLPRSDHLITGADLQLPTGASIAPGTRVITRVNAWYLHETTVTAVEGNRLRLAKPTSYPALKGWGYLLVGQPWMLDRPREWVYDPANRQLQLWMPDSAAPPAGLAAVVLATGIDMQGRSNVIIDGLVVRRTGQGVNLASTTAVQFRNGVVEDTVDFCVVAAGSTNNVIEGSSLSRCGTDAIAGETDTVGEARGLAVRSNVVRDAAVLMQGETPVSLPRRSRGAIVTGSNAVVTDNVVVNSGYIGIRIHSGSRVEGNFVHGACSTLDDCGGIYTWQSSDVTIRGNVVVRSRGYLPGLPPAERETSAQGIYLDETTVASLVDDNTVVDADNGIQIHVSSRNTLSGNRLFANRRSQIWLQSTRNRENAAGDVVGNLVTGNQIAAVVPGSVGIWLSNSIGPTSAFGFIDNNRYADRGNATAVLDSTPAGTRAYTLAQWQTSTTVDLPAGRDSMGSGTPAAAYRVAGANIVPNAGVATDLAGWSTWSGSAPQPQLLRAVCPQGWCLTLQGGGSTSLVASPNFSTSAGQWYRLSVDLLGDRDNQPLALILRRGGGGSNGYESLSDRSLQTTAGRSWRRHTVTFQATKTVNARDLITGDIGARFDIEGVLPGRSVTLANLELVPVNLSPTAFITGVLVNVGTSEIQSGCPLPAAQAAVCTRLVRLSDYSPIIWPQRVPRTSAVLYYNEDPTLADSDSDGIADNQDSCPGTSATAAVNAVGCALPVG